MIRVCRAIVVLGCALIFTSGVMSSAIADEYPTKPIRMLVGYGAGGAVDIVSRVLADRLEKRLGQRVLVENRPGGGTIIALQALAKSAPDGYTAMMADVAMSANPALRTNLPYDTMRDFEPVVLVALFPGVMAVNINLPVKNVKDFIKLAKSEPGKLNYANSGLGGVGHLGPELFKSETGTDIVSIPYQSGAQAMQALMSGDAQMAFATAPPLLPFKNNVRILAVANEKRLASLPDVPTFAELGLPGVKVALWVGVFLPRGTDESIVQKLNAEVNAVLQIPEVKERIVKLGGEVMGGTSQDLNTFLHSEVAKWQKIIPASLRH